MSPSTAEAPTAKKADVRRGQQSARHRSASAEAAPESAPQSPAPAAAAWPDTVANPRRIRVR